MPHDHNNDYYNRLLHLYVQSQLPERLWYLIGCFHAIGDRMYISIDINHPDEYQILGTDSYGPLRPFHIEVLEDINLMEVHYFMHDEPQFVTTYIGPPLDY